MKDYKPLLEQYLAIVESKQNQENKKFWENADEPYLIERWRGRSTRKTHTPFTMAMDISGYSRVLDINCLDYYGNAEDQLYHQLRYAIWEFENLKCHRYFENTVFISFGSIFEASMFGAGINYLSGSAPWIDETSHIINSRNDLDKIKPFDFYKTGLCEKVHLFYETMKKLTSGYNIKVMFPVTIRSPFSTAIMIRGFENLLMDIYDDPDFFHDVLRVITDYISQYSKKRAEFLGESIPQCYLFNDEISTPMISNEMYKTHILPFEIELSKLCGGVRYWHSCGVTDEFYESVKTIPGLKMMHIGPWSDVEKAAEVFKGDDIALEICLNATSDVYERTEEEMTQKLLKIKQACDGKVRYSVRADGFGVIDSVQNALDKIRLWNKVAQQVFPA